MVFILYIYIANVKIKYHKKTIIYFNFDLFCLWFTRAKQCEELGLSDKTGF